MGIDDTEQRRATGRGFHAKARTKEQNSSLTDKGDNERERIRNRERQKKKGKGERERGRERSG